jgi:hypothetical protein
VTGFLKSATAWAIKIWRHHAALGQMVIVDADHRTSRISSVESAEEQKVANIVGLKMHEQKLNHHFKSHRGLGRSGRPSDPARTSNSRMRSALRKDP